MGAARIRVLVAAALLLAASTLPGRSSAQGTLACRIERAHAKVFAQLNREGQVLYYGHAIMYTSGCRELSPGDISVTFEPIAGSTGTCDPRGTLYSDEAVCTTGVGGAVQGTPVVVTATGKTLGSGGAAAFASSCTVIMPAYDQSACSFPIRLAQ